LRSETAEGNKMLLNERRHPCVDILTNQVKVVLGSRRPPDHESVINQEGGTDVKKRSRSKGLNYGATEITGPSAGSQTRSPHQAFKKAS